MSVERWARTWTCKTKIVSERSFANLSEVESGKTELDLKERPYKFLRS